MQDVHFTLSKNGYFGFVDETEILAKKLKSFVETVAARILDSGGELREPVLRSIDEHPLALEYFRVDSLSLDETFGLKEEFLFPKSNSVLGIFCGTHGGGRKMFKLGDAQSLPQWQQFFAACAEGSSSAAELQTAASAIRPGLFDSLSELGMFAETGIESAARRAFTKPGIYRLQHATLLYRTETAGLLVDPHLHSDYETTVPRLTGNFGCEDLVGKVDAILISHAHRDHWHLPSLLMFPRDIPIIIPRVPRRSILSDDLEECLRGFGFTNISAPEWYAPPIVIRDLEIHSLPFYGEQPLRYDQPMHPELRSWGNTYLIRTGFYTSWFLIDSGADFSGSMTEVAEFVREKFGAIDTILSNLRPFRPSTPFYITGSGSYWLSLSARQMRVFSSMERDCISLGTAGCAEVCRIAGARYFLPYANWWSNPGTPGPQEDLLMADFDVELKRQNADTIAISWCVGDGMIATRQKSFELQSYRDQIPRS